MNKLFKPFIVFFKIIYFIVDRFLVMPISRFIYRISELSRSNSGRIEKLLNRPNILVYVSLFFAIAIFLVTDNRVINLLTEQAEILSGQRVNVIYNEEAYVVEGVPETVDIILIGSRSDLYLATQLGEHSVVLDLSGYSVGTYRVRLRYNRSIQSINYKLDPGVITVKISEKLSENKPLSYDIINENHLDSKLSIKSIKLDRSEVLVKGSAEALEAVASVRALIDLKAANFTELGTFTASNNLLVAYDNQGNRLDNVEIVPARISATVEIESFKAEKTIKIIPTGDLTTGFAIANLTSSVRTVEVYGDEEVIKNLPFIEVRIDVSGLSDRKTFNVNLVRPPGVRYMSETKTTIQVTVDREISKEFTDVQLRQINLGNNYTALIVGEAVSPSAPFASVTVIASGVANVINALEGNAIIAEIDLSGLAVGTHDVPVNVRTDDVRIKLTPKVSTIKVNIRAR